MDYSLLSGSPLFKSLSAEVIEDLLALLPHRVKKFKAGALIAQSGEQVISLLIITSGLVKGEMVDFGGRTIKIEDIPAPGVLAPGFMFGSKNRFPVNVIAITDTELMVIDKQSFLRLLMNNDKILVNFLDILSNRSQFLSEKIKFLSFKTIKGKLAQYLLALAGEKNNEIQLDRTQHDLADYFGVARPSLARVLKEMEEERILKVNGKRVRIIDKTGLYDLTRD